MGLLNQGGNIHSWLQILAIGAVLVWGASKIDSRVETVEEQQTTMIANQRVIRSDVSDMKRSLGKLSDEMIYVVYVDRGAQKLTGELSDGTMVEIPAIVIK